VTAGRVSKHDGVPVIGIIVRVQSFYPIASVRQQRTCGCYAPRRYEPDKVQLGLQLAATAVTVIRKTQEESGAARLELVHSICAVSHVRKSAGYAVPSCNQPEEIRSPVIHTVTIPIFLAIPMRLPNS
jgi:hypothetical protein